jgi:hypothetical protein
MCGRRTTPFVFIGLEPIGPSCARNMELTKAKTPKNNRIRFAAYNSCRDNEPKILDLFEVRP